MKANNPDKISSQSLSNQKPAHQMPRTFEEYIRMGECPYLKNKKQAPEKNI